MVAAAVHSFRAFVTGGNYGDLRVIEAKVTRNAYAYPYAQATVRIARPTEQIMGVLDPRKLVRITLVAEKTYSSVPGNDSPMPKDEFAQLRLWLVDRSIDYSDDSVTLTLSGAELLVEDFRLTASAPIKFGPQPVRNVVNAVLKKMGRALVTTTPLDQTALTQDVEWAPGQSAWEFLTPLLEATGRRLWADELDNFQLGPRITPPAGSNLFVLGESPITSAVESLARTTDYYDAVHIRYTWTDEDEIERVRFDSAQAYPTVRRVESIEYDDTRYPGPGAARERLKRALTRGRKVDLAFAQSYAVNPGDSATIRLNADELSAGYITAVRWSFPGYEMTIDTRDVVLVPQFAWINAPAGLSWSEAPAGVTWTNSDQLFKKEA